MEEHCSSRLRQQWGQTCDRIAGNLGLRDTSSLLRAGVDVVPSHGSYRVELLRDQIRAFAPPASGYSSTVAFSVDGTPLPLVSTLRILGLFLQSNGKHTTLITQLSNTVHQTMRLTRRIANRHHGMREHDLRPLVQAFVLSRFVYSLPYLFLSQTETK
ncbi:hypothetical protein MTO96_011426 [Rhipicephalus appendiculatus]